MAHLGQTFDATQVKPDAGFDVMPPGWQTAMITESAYEPTANKKGKNLKLTWQIADGEHKGRKLFSNLCIEHANPETARIARGQLSAICHATGVLKPKDSVELHNIPIEIHVGVKKRDDTGENQNEVKGYRKRGGSAAAAPVAIKTGAAPADAKTPPWQRG